MPDPIQVERDFQELMEYFDSIPSIRRRHQLFFDFLSSLEGEFRKYESYILQLLDDLPEFSNHLSWSGIDPEDVEGNLSMLEKIQSEIELSIKSDHYSEIKRNLYEVCLLLQVCLGNIEKADAYLQKLTGVSLSGPSTSIQAAKERNQPFNRLHERLAAVLKQNQKRSNEQIKSLQRLHKETEALIKHKNLNILVPVAEKYDEDQGKNNRYGRLRSMTVELYGEAESKTNDELIWATHIYGAEVPSLGQTTAPINASRKLFELSGFERTAGRYYRGGLRFEISAAIHNGKSANLAIAALWYSILLKASGQRERYRIHSNIAITGDIDENGIVQPVDEISILLKAKAVFFSWASLVVIPASQRTPFEDEINKLKERYPQRILEVISVSRLAEIFYDRRVAEHNVQGRLPYMMNRLKNQDSKFVLIPIIIVLLLIVARLVYGPIDKNPQNLTYEDRFLILQNQNGIEVKRLEVGAQTVSFFTNSNGEVHPGTFAANPLAILIDITNDGFNEVIFGKRVRLSQTNREISEISAYSISGDSLIWRRELILNYDFPRQSGVTQQEMLIREMGLVETIEGPKVVVNANSFYYFQTILYLIDAKNGKVESEYLHIGHIRDMILQDINGDNQAEVLFSGINNAYWLASVGVLDIGAFHGHSPLTKDYRPSGIEPASELNYILIPKTIVAEYTDPLMKYNEGKNLYYDVANNTIRVLVEESRIPFRKEFGDVMVSISFENDLKPIGIGTSDVYDIVARQLFEEGEIRKIPDFDYFQAYKDSILYWTGKEFLLAEEYFKED